MLPEAVLKDIENVLREAIEGLRAGDPKKVKDASFRLVHSSTLYQDVYTITTAVALYSLAKILEREEKMKKRVKDWEGFLKEVEQLLVDALASIEEKDLSKYLEKINKICDEIREREEEYRMYVDFILKKARIKSASRIYEHGVSLQRVAELLKVPLWDLMNYIGKTSIHDLPDFVTKSPEERLKELEEMLG